MVDLKASRDPDVTAQVVEKIREAAPRVDDTDAVYESVLEAVTEEMGSLRGKTRTRDRRRLFTWAAQLAATLVFVAGIAALAVIVKTPEAPKEGPGLPVVGSYSKLRQLASARANGYEYFRDWPGAAPGMGAQKLLSATEGGYSQTNIQVAGVDEADIVKTDGTNIYQIVGGGVRVTKARPVGEMRVAGALREKGFSPFELYVDDTYVVVLGNIEELGEAGRRPYRYGAVRADVYEKSERSLPQKIREITVEGQYVSSRKIGSALYLITSRYLDQPRIMENRSDPGDATPAYIDSAIGNGVKRVAYNQINYLPDSAEPSYLVVAGADLSKANKEVAVRTILGAAQNVYSSTDNLYVAATTYEASSQDSAPSPGGPVTIMPRPMVAPGQAARTELYKFSLNGGEVSFESKGRVPGTMLNQFSMDEYDGYLRVATTTGEVWSEGADSAKNHLFVLDKELKVVGKIENIAPGERIYSARFMGERAYMVTFKKVDPLFVIDLSDPAAPTILGELKIPGYSDYLHPYGSKYIIGFGKEAVDAREQLGGGDFAWYQGMKIAMFDVSDVRRPVEKFKTVIGDRGTDSELLQNHKALLIDARRGFMAFPVTVMERKTEERGLGDGEYGEFAFQGAYVYDIDPNNGISLRGRVTHLTPEEQGQAFDNYAFSSQVRRALYIGDILYVVSDIGISAHDLATMRELGSVGLLKR